MRTAIHRIIRPHCESCHRVRVLWNYLGYYVCKDCTIPAAVSVHE